MAKLQIFVLALILAQGYCSSLSLSTLPAEQEQPICVTYVKLLLQAIIDKLSNLPVNRPTPEIEITLPESPEVEITLPEDPDIPEVISPEPQPEVSANPCTACFDYLTTLIVSAQKAAAARRSAIAFY